MNLPRPQPSRELQSAWGARALWTQLEPLLPGLTVEVLARSASTNSELLARARGAEGGPRGGRRSADTQPCLLVAEHQTAGRGRMGRGWRSARGDSLTFSLALALAPRDWSGLSLAVGVAVAEALQPAAGPLRLALKWPNDLWLVDAANGAAGGRKLGGILIETLAAGERRLAVIGIGLNIAPLTGPLPAELQGHWACLHELDPRAAAESTLARLALPLVQAIKVFERQGFAAVVERFAALDALRGQAVVTSDPRAANGTACGVDGQGGLRVDTAHGPRIVSGGEVTVRPASPVLAQ